MARSLGLRSAPKEQQGSGSNLSARGANVTRSRAPADPAQEFAPSIAALQSLLSSSDFDRDAFLDRIARVALVLTGASGAAIAIRQQQLIVCRARRGVPSPPLGAKLDANSGISGECLRTGRALQCSDTENDPRVEREVCRRLGIRSIAVVPIGKGTGTAGVLEVVSARPQAFEDAQLHILAELARLVAEGVIDTVESEIASLQPVVVPAPPSIHTADAGGAAIDSSSLGRSERRSPLNERRYYSIAIAVFLIPALLIAMALLRRERHGKTASAPAAQTVDRLGPSPQSQPSGENKQAQGKSQLASADLLAARPSPAGGEVTTKHESDLSERKFSRSPEQPQISRPETPIIVPEEVRRNQPLSGDVSADSPPPAPLQLGTADLVDGAKAIGEVTSSPNPSLSAVPVFQGISGGTPDRSVNPVYPPEALALRLEGTVVLSVVIDESGSVQILKTLNGDPILARAAIDAVRQWHYHPYLLNGQPVKREAKITLTFKLP